MCIRDSGSSFASVLKQAHNGLLGDGVKVTSVYEDNSTDMNMVYDPSHPDADENGYVTYPNVNVVQAVSYTHLIVRQFWRGLESRLRRKK